MFSRASLLLVFIAAVSVSARPCEKRWNIPSISTGSSSWGKSDSWSGSWPGSSGWTGWGSWGGRSDKPALRKKSYLHYEENAQASGTCDIQSAVQYMDLSSVSPALPAPGPDLSLFQVVLGRGTQNYTCDLANATATPTPVGAVATLFDFSCVAANKPALLRSLTQIAINHPVPTENNTHASVIDDLTSGYHYFLDSTTAFFNLNTATNQYGMGGMSKVNESDAPANSCTGQHNGPSYGAVKWLKLDASAESKPGEDSWKEIYRLNTAGGNPPEACSDINEESFTIPYAAEYWIFK